MLANTYLITFGGMLLMTTLAVAVAVRPAATWRRQRRMRS